MMGVLALATWWLVENAPVVERAGPAKPLRHVADYSMSGFSVRRFGPDGRLRAQIEGDVLRHYPDTDTIEVDNPRIRSYADDGLETIATARQAVSNGDGSEVQLLGGAEVVRSATGASPPIEFRGEFLHAFLDQELLRSHLPVVVRRGTAELRANGLDYRHADQKLELKGRVRAIFPPAGRRTEAADGARGRAAGADHRRIERHRAGARAGVCTASATACAWSRGAPTRSSAGSAGAGSTRGG